MKALRVAPLTFLALLSLTAATAQAPKIGDPAPAITLDNWLNTEADKPPTLESLKGRVVMLEFWGTWCGPCVRAMPEVQKLHERYHKRGLTVLAISYEKPDVMKPFLTQNAYTMPVGSDPEKKVVTSYGIRGWPATYVIDKEGKIAYVGGPYGAEAEVEKALGIEASPKALLTAWLDTLKESKDKQREAIARLQEKAPADFDLRAWALSHVPGEQAAGPEPQAESKPKPKDAAAKAAPTADGADLLRKCVAAWNGKDAAQKQELLRRIGAGGPEVFDLGSFTREAYAKAFPVDVKEIQGLLQQQKFAAVVEALVTRNPGGPVLGIAAKDKKLEDFCKKKVADTRTSAKKAIMAQGWVFGSVKPSDNDKFWKELSVSGMSLSEDRKQVNAILLDGAPVTKAGAEGFIRNRLAQALVMDALGSGQPPRMNELDKLVEKERQKILKPLEESYGPISGKK